MTMELTNISPKTHFTIDSFHHQESDLERLFSMGFYEGAPFFLEHSFRNGTYLLCSPTQQKIVLDKKLCDGIVVSLLNS